jgi:hypothetical protein
LVCLPLLLAGCGSTEEASVRGTVTFEGKAVEGFITFFPIQSKEATRGVKIVDGAYEISGLTPGRKRVLVSTAPDHHILEDKSGRKSLKFTLAKDFIAATAVGNNRMFEITAGSQTLDIVLKKPAR